MLAIRKVGLPPFKNGIRETAQLVSAQQKTMLFRRVERSTDVEAAAQMVPRCRRQIDHHRQPDMTWQGRGRMWKTVLEMFLLEDLLP